MQLVDEIKSWMAAHVFVSMAIAMLLAVLLTMLALLIGSVEKRHRYLWVFRLLSLTGVALGINAMAMGAGSGAMPMIEVGAGFLVVSLLSLACGSQVAYEHEAAHARTKAELEKSKSDVARLKDNPAIRVMLDPVAGADAQKQQQK